MAKKSSVPHTSLAFSSVAVVDDNPIIREGLRSILASESGLKLCGFATDRKGVFALLEECHPDLLLLNFSLGSIDPIALIKDLVGRFPSTGIIVTSVAPEALCAARALCAGAAAWLPPQATGRDIVTALRGAQTVKSGVTGSIKGRGSLRNDSFAQSLTDRELHVFRLIGRGLGTGEISRQLNLSRKTIETHREHIKIKLGFRSADALRQGAIAWESASKKSGKPPIG